MTLLSILATIVGSLMGLSSIPQIIKIFKRKSAKDISAITYSIIAVGEIVWILYGLELNNLPLIISYSVSVICAIVILAGWFLYGR